MCDGNLGEVVLHQEVKQLSGCLAQLAWFSLEYEDKMDQAKFSQIYTNSKDLLGLYCEKVRAVVSLMHVIAGHLKPSLILASKAGE